MVSEDEGGEEILDKYFCFGQTAISCCLDEMATQVFLHLSIGRPSLMENLVAYFYWKGTSQIFFSTPCVSLHEPLSCKSPSLCTVTECGPLCCALPNTIFRSDGIWHTQKCFHLWVRENFLGGGDVFFRALPKLPPILATCTNFLRRPNSRFESQLRTKNSILYSI